MKQHQFSLTELEDMMPFEREIYVTLLKDHLKKEENSIDE